MRGAFSICCEPQRGNRFATVWPVVSCFALAEATDALGAVLERESETIEEVIVTARKVEEPATDVPASVQALAGTALDDLDLSRLYELQFEIPGLVVNNLGMFGAGLALRGVGDEGGGPVAIAPHVNGTYLGSTGFAVGRWFDMARIEVLKGPQGTLYGRNSTGGSVNFVTRRPEAGFDAEIETAYASYDTTRVQGHVNVPLATWAVRLSAVASEGDGYVRNSIDGREFGEDDYRGARLSLARVESDDLDVHVMLQRVVDDGGAGDLWSPNRNFLPEPGDIRRTTVTHPNPFLRIEGDLATINASYALGSGELQSATGVAHSEVRALDDCAGLPVLEGCVRGLSPSEYRQWTQEFRLSSASDERFVWMVGMNYFDSEQDADFSFTAPRLNAVDSASTTNEQAYAAFARAHRDLSERWRIGAGLRWTTEEKSLADVTSVAGGPPIATRASDTDDDASWSAELQYRASSGAMAYLSAATGFKSGGVTTERLPNGDFDDFDPEHLMAYEGGLKLMSHRWKLDAAAFLYRFEDMQVRTVQILDNVPVSVIDNAARAEIYGVDAASTVHITNRLAASAAAVWLPKREFVDYKSDASNGDLSGNLVSRAPQWTVSASVDYATPIAGTGELSVSLRYNLRSHFYFTKENLSSESQERFALWHLYVRYEPAQRGWYAFAAGRNLTDEDYFNQAFIQSSPGYPDTYEVGFGLRF